MKVRLYDVNENIVCKLCAGYYIDATTVTECLHTCKSTILPVTMLYVCDINKMLLYATASYDKPERKSFFSLQELRCEVSAEQQTLSTMQYEDT